MSDRARTPLWADATFHTTSQRRFAINKPMFISPQPAGRKITAGFSWMQRIGRASSMDVWFPEIFQKELDHTLAMGAKLGPEHFPAQWAAVRQFELLQEAGNYKIYDMDVSYLSRTMTDLTRNMRGGGYRVTVATIGSYAEDESDELEILDQRLQHRISKLTHMLYLGEESENANAAIDKVLAEERWDYQTALPHIGVTLGSRDLFRPNLSMRRASGEFVIPAASHEIKIASWVGDMRVTDNTSGKKMICVLTEPCAGEYTVRRGVYRFAPADAHRNVVIEWQDKGGNEGDKHAKSDRKHKLSAHFFDILSMLPQNHIVHDTAIGLQLPESINEHEWIYLADGDMKVGAFNVLLADIFSPFDKMSLGRIEGRADAGDEIKCSVQHMRGYGDRLTPDADQFQRDAARYALKY